MSHREDAQSHAFAESGERFAEQYRDYVSGYFADGLHGNETR